LDYSPLEGAISFEANFYMPIPASWSEKKKQRMVGKPHISKPDWSNLLKFVEDCCTGILFKDDALIAKVSGIKVYDFEPRTEIILLEIE
jgi:Holliday junction resolvase RusA-like endonuclease